MNRISRHLVLATFSAVIFVGCRSTKDILRTYDNNIVQGKYADAAVEPAEKAEAGGRDALCWQLNVAGAQRLAGNGDEAIRRLDLAEDLFVDYDSRGGVKTVATDAWSMMSGDYVLPYGGSGQDRIFCCLYKAIEFGVRGNAAAVRTELNRAAQHQANWLSDRGADLAAANERLKADAGAYARKEGVSVPSATNSAELAFANPGFSDTIRQRTGFDTATGGRLELLTADDYANRYLERVRSVFRNYVGDEGVKPANQVTVFVEDGLCPVRDEWRVDLPTVIIPGLNRYVQYAGMALPELRYRNAAATAYSLTSGGVNYAMPEIQDVDCLIKTEFDVYFRGALAREITRAVIKVGAQVALGATANGLYHSNDRNVQGIAALVTLAQLGVATWSYCSTEADVRSWNTLPKKVYMLSVPRPADGVITVNCGLAKVRLEAPEGNTMAFVSNLSSTLTPVAKSFTIPN